MLPDLIKIGLIVDFKLNQGFISEVLCINREKPVNECNGQCYLSDQLEKAEEPQSEKVPLRIKPQVETSPYLHACFLAIPTSLKQERSIRLPDKPFLYHSSYTSRIFQPPETPWV